MSVHPYTISQLTIFAIRVSQSDETGDATLSRFLEEHPKFAGRSYQDVLIMFLAWALGKHWILEVQKY